MDEVLSSKIIVGTDTHKFAHAAITQLGARLGQVTIPVSAKGYRDLEAWVRSFGTVRAFGIEDTGSCGAGLSRFLCEQGHAVLAVGRPNRQLRHQQGKTDHLDAEGAARAVLGGQATALPNPERARSNDPPSRCHAARADQFDHGLSQGQLARTCSALDEEIKAHDAHLDQLTQQCAPTPVEAHGIETNTVAEMLLLVGDNPEQIRSKAALAKLCGACPVPASSGKRSRHRLNRGGHCQANAALYRVVIVRMRINRPSITSDAVRPREGASRRLSVASSGSSCTKFLAVTAAPRQRRHRSK